MRYYTAILIQIGLLCVSTHVEAFPNFASLFLNMGKETSGSGQNEEIDVLQPYPVTKGEALRALHLEPCPDGDGIACAETEGCFHSLQDVCHGEMVCQTDEICETQDDPDGCREDYVDNACAHTKAMHWLTTYGAPNFDAGLDKSYALQAFFDLWFFYGTRFCEDGRIKCRGDCLLYDELCDSSTSHCKCNGKNITEIIKEYRTIQAFLSFTGGKNGGGFGGFGGMFSKRNSLYSGH